MRMVDYIEKSLESKISAIMCEIAIYKDFTMKKNIKFQPTGKGYQAYDADTGEKLGMVYDMSCKPAPKKNNKKQSKED